MNMTGPPQSRSFRGTFSIPSSGVDWQRLFGRVVPRHLPDSRDVEVNDVRGAESVGLVHAEDPSLRLAHFDQRLDILGLLQVVDLGECMPTAVAAEVAFRCEVDVLDLKGNP